MRGAQRSTHSEARALQMCGVVGVCSVQMWHVLIEKTKHKFGRNPSFGWAMALQILLVHKGVLSIALNKAPASQMRRRKVTWWWCFHEANR